MTCEIAVMNKYAVVIAADSAVTSTNYNGETRYSNGGNKIFQLSHHCPVGVMVYGSAALLGCPWEVLIKEFRNQLGAKELNTVADYAEEFFNWLAKQTKWLPDAEKYEHFKATVGNTMVSLLESAVKQKKQLIDSSLPIATRKQYWTDYVVAENAKLTNLNLDAQINAKDISQNRQKILVDLKPAYESYLQDLIQKGIDLTQIIDVTQWVTLAVDFVYKKYADMVSPSGLVFAGYGKDQAFPSVVDFRVTGFLDKILLRKKESARDVSNQQSSSIIQFATTSMVDTFTQGYGFDVFLAVQRAFDATVSQLGQDIISAAGGQQPANLQSILKSSSDSFRQSWTGEMLDSHYVKLAQNIGALPIDEMVHLAETMIVLESLKEKVTSPSRSVGGPIDVAVITRFEGLVWIKRKHFFDGQKNPRYFERQKIR